MRWIPIFSAVCFAGLAACAGEPASKSVKAPGPLSYQGRERKSKAPPVLIAPPPAYGNKIVMAQAGTTSATN
jgi:hypothetical protein